MRFPKWLLIASLAASLSACAPDSKIRSNTSAELSGNARRVFVITTLRRDMGPKVAEGFERKLMQSAMACGVEMQISQIAELELDPGARMAALARFEPDAIVTMDIVSGRRLELGGEYASATYDLRLFQPPALGSRSDAGSANRPAAASGAALKEVPARPVRLSPVWRAEVQFDIGPIWYPRDERGEAFADAVSTKLRADGVFSCED